MLVFARPLSGRPNVSVFSRGIFRQANVSTDRPKNLVHSIGPVPVTQTRPHKKITPVPRDYFLDFGNALYVALEQDEGGRLQPLGVLA